MVTSHMHMTRGMVRLKSMLEVKTYSATVEWTTRHARCSYLSISSQSAHQLCLVIFTNVQCCTTVDKVDIFQCRRDLCMLFLACLTFNGRALHINKYNRYDKTDT